MTMARGEELAQRRFSALSMVENGDLNDGLPFVRASSGRVDGRRER